MIHIRREQRKRKEAAMQAVQEAHVELHEVKARSDEVAEVSGSLRELRERNHFAERLTQIMKGQKGDA